MKTTVFLLLISVLLGTNAKADFNLSANHKAIVCYGEDNQSVSLDAKRTGLQYTVEGETLGAKKIIDVKTDHRSFVSYSTDELTLTLSAEGDSFLYKGAQDAQEVECK